MLWDHADERAWRRKHAAGQAPELVEMPEELEEHEETGSGTHGDSGPADSPSIARAAEEREAEVCM